MNPEEAEAVVDVEDESPIYEIPSPELVANDLRDPAEVIAEEAAALGPTKPQTPDGPPSGPAALTAWESLSGTVNVH